MESQMAAAGSPQYLLCVEPTPSLAPQVARLFPAPANHVAVEKSIDRVPEYLEQHLCDVLLVTGQAVSSVDADLAEFLDLICGQNPSVQILFLVEPAHIELAMSALKAGSYQYARLPVSDRELRLLIETALETRAATPSAVALPRGQQMFQSMVGQSPAMMRLYQQIRQAAGTDIPVLLTGETGTGKELVANAIHQQSRRANQPYVPVHLGALPQELVAGELFGHEKGAFTGATAQRPGKFEQAIGGTVFLDEIATVNEKVQISLLRLLEYKSFHRIGGQQLVSADVRLIAASNQDLHAAVAGGTFREDLFYRLEVFPINLPPLRRRHGDIPRLIDAFVKRYNNEFNKAIVGIAPDGMALLESYDWPGNVRELRNVIQRAILICAGDVLLPEHLPVRIRAAEGGAVPGDEVTFAVGTPLAEVEREMVLRALEAANHNRTAAAKLLGISRRALYNRLRRLKIAKPC